MTETEAVVLTEMTGAVLVVTLNRPDRLNAWTRRMQEQYFDILEAAEDAPSVGAVVLTGAGAGFCAGADLTALDRVGGGDPAARRVLKRPTSLPYHFRKPLIGAINGACAGIGLVQALYCDVRFVSREAKLTTAYVRRGLIAEHGSAWLLSRVVGLSVASDLLLSGRTVQGDEVQRLGLANWLCDPATVVADAVAYAAELAERSSPKAMAVIKQQLREDATTDLDAAWASARAHMLQTYEWPDLREGVASFRERRPPRFPALEPISRTGDI